MNIAVDGNIQAAGITPAVISILGLKKSFDAAKPVLDGIDLVIGKGSLVALIGANGTGKSTLLRCIPKLVLPDSGTIDVFDTPLIGKRGKALRGLRSKIGFVFQKHNLVGRLSALSNVVQGAQAQGFGMRAWCQSFASPRLRGEAMACLDRVGLAHAAGQRADRLSGGQSQRVAIARALMQKSEIVLADEPAASLDPQAGDDVMQLLLTLMREEGATVVFTSHHLKHAIDYADRIVGLSGGRVVLDAPAQALREQDLRSLYV
ncbi:MAG: phosphonate ABC transporter ATP-binding protein [Aestuariivirga sp.]